MYVRKTIYMVPEFNKKNKLGRITAPNPVQDHTLNKISTFF